MREVVRELQFPKNLVLSKYSEFDVSLFLKNLTQFKSWLGLLMRGQSLIEE